ncbi:hypothetical protein Bca4012_006216 [Brassica carinata]|nr:unnamed protein product [Brassica napus]CAF1708445.1 unnamed protein product [Brassica napus]
MERLTESLAQRLLDSLMDRLVVRRALYVLEIARAAVKEGGNEPTEKELEDGETLSAFVKRACVSNGQEEPSKKPRLRSPIQKSAKKEKDKKEKQTKEKDYKEKPKNTKKDEQGNRK